jgi:hypothetical protein
VVAYLTDFDEARRNRERIELLRKQEQQTAQQQSINKIPIIPIAETISKFVLKNKPKPIQHTNYHKLFSKPERHCENCNKPINPRPCRIKQGRGNYCKECYNKLFPPPTYKITNLQRRYVEAMCRPPCYFIDKGMSREQAIIVCKGFYERLSIKQLSLAQVKALELDVADYPPMPEDIKKIIFKGEDK